MGYNIKALDRNIYHAGDTDFIPEMHDLGKIDIVFLPVGGTFTMGVCDAIRAIEPKIFIPMHFSNVDINRFKGAVANKPNIRVKLLRIGETIIL